MPKTPPAKGNKTARKRPFPHTKYLRDISPRTGKLTRKRVTRSAKVFDAVLDRLADGELLSSICADDHMPSRQAWYRWCAEDEDLAARFAEAKEAMIEGEIDDILSLADMPVSGKDAHVKLQQRKMMIDARKWRIQKLQPQKYGPQSQLFLADHRTTPVSNLTDDELNAEIKRLQDAANAEGSE